MSRNLIYLDNNSSIPCAPEVLGAMLPFFREIYIVIWIEIRAWIYSPQQDPTHPACLTKPHSVRTNKVNKKIENHFNSMAIDWLVDKFNELPEASKKKFLVIIQQVDKVLKKAIL